MKINSQKLLAEEIIRSWLKPTSNYVVIAPPMSGSNHFFAELTSPPNIHRIVSKSADLIAIAKLDNRDFHNDLLFAKRVAVKWGVLQSVNDSTFDDPLEVMNFAVARLVEAGKIPVIIIQRFHEALKKLGEEIGIHLRNLEHEYNLKTVVELPVSLDVLRQRWDAIEKEKAPFLQSDWGQGHSHKLLKGYSLAELKEKSVTNKLSQGIADELFSATAGMVELVDRLLPDLEGKNTNGAARYIQSRSLELCERLVRWLDPQNLSHVYKKSVVNLLDPQLCVGSAINLRHHDWADIILDKTHRLNCKMLAWASVFVLARQSEPSFIQGLRLLIDTKKYDQAAPVLEILIETDERSSHKWEAVKLVNDFSSLTQKLFLEGVHWHQASRILFLLDAIRQQIESEALTLESVLAWRPLVSMLSDFSREVQNNRDARIETYLCQNYTREEVLPFFHLLKLRLQSTSLLDPYLALQSIVTQPEAILQIYSYYALGIEFWNFEGLAPEEKEKIKGFSRKSITINCTSNPLGFVELLYLAAFRTKDLDTSSQFIRGYEDIDKFEKFYEVRKGQVHSTAFAQEARTREYVDFCHTLIERAFECIYPDVSTSWLQEPGLMVGKLINHILPKS
ncbi:hypothetical protein [Pseudomonas sp. LA5]|uniref:hypothetical protein n=1 Tax=Pseudomonas sp. LA5 TaxID=3027850 RepID=UPI00235F0178|nr:hypothetical protein [Pseudomonas sp. LA5]